MGNLPRRLLVAAVALPLLWWLNFWDRPLPILLLIAAAAMGALRELFGLLRGLGHRPFERLGYLAAAGFLFAALQQEQSGTIQAAFLLALLVAQMFRVGARENAGDMGVTLFAVMYAGWLPSLIVRLRLVDEGAQWTFVLLAATWLYDSGAFFAGTWIGRHKLWPAVSPGKTWEGCAGGLVLSLGAVLGARALQAANPGWTPLVPIPLDSTRLLWVVPAVCLAAQVGDLAESMLKRAANVKDSGALLPGHGGLLDKFDSFLFTGPLVYYLASIL